MGIETLTVKQADKQAAPKAFMRIVPYGANPAILPQDGEEFLARSYPRLQLMRFLTINWGVLLVVVVTYWVFFSKNLLDESAPWGWRITPLICAVLTLVISVFLTWQWLSNNAAQRREEQRFLDGYRTMRQSNRPVSAKAVKVWSHSVEGSLLIYVALLRWPGGELLVRHTSGAGQVQPFEAPVEGATFYVWQCPEEWTITQVARRGAPDVKS